MATRRDPISSDITGRRAALLRVERAGAVTYEVAGDESDLRFAGSIIALAKAHREDAESLIDALSPRLVLGPATTEQLRLNAEARSAFLAEWPSLTSAQVADLLGSTAKNRSALAHKLSRRGAIFSVQFKRQDLYPVFQFDPVQGRPLPAMPGILAALVEAGMRGWEIAFWFVEPNGWLDGDARPVDLVASSPDAVVDAASHEAEVPE